MAMDNLDNSFNEIKIALLREFIVLTESLNFTQAAKKLDIPQPVLSRHIREFEEYAGGTLFRRSTRHVRLTTMGTLIQQEVMKILKQVDHSVSVIDHFTERAKKHLSIAYLGDAFNNILVKTIDEFREKYHSINVDYQETELGKIVDLIRANEYDFGLILRPNVVDTFDDLHTLALQKDPLYAVVNCVHPIAKQQFTSLKEIANYPIIRTNPKIHSYAENFSTNFFIKNHIDFTLQKEYPNFNTCLFEIELNQMAVFLVPQHRLHLLTHNTVGVLIQDNCFHILELIWNKDNLNPNLERFIQVLKNNI
ncbi:LysR family transcriptional regulator [Lonepinella koalarum]|uniref:LysR family transcriptional regulator n=1 Tax=Lonepinella koalarum TaxID=53417 RepID=UPI003F6DF86F